MPPPPTTSSGLPSCRPFRGNAEQARLFAAHPDAKWVAPPGNSLHRLATNSTSGRHRPTAGWPPTPTASASSNATAASPAHSGYGRVRSPPGLRLGRAASVPRTLRLTLASPSEAVAQSHLGKAASRSRTYTPGLSCGTTERLTLCVRRRRWPLSEPTLRNRSSELARGLCDSLPSQSDSLIWAPGEHAYPTEHCTHPTNQDAHRDLGNTLGEHLCDQMSLLAQ